MCKEIREFNKSAAKLAKLRWDSIAKPLESLGEFEKIIIQLAGIQGTPDVDISKRTVLVMCADNGVVEEGVTQTGKEVTAVVSGNLVKGDASVCAMARACGADVIPIDVGIDGDVSGIINKKIMRGTNNFSQKAAMSREETEKAIKTGIDCVKMIRDTKIIITGEMGIGNTTTSAAVASVLLGREPEEMTGRGAGLSSEGLYRKITVIKNAIEKYKPDKNDAVDVLSKVGGLDIAALCGVFIGGAVYGVPIVIDGFISAVAALCASVIDKRCLNYMIASHVSNEPAARRVLDALGKRAVIDAGMCLGEGTGGVMLIPLLDCALAVYNEMKTFDGINIESYKPQK